jgi:hypothetical protein
VIFIRVYNFRADHLSTAAILALLIHIVFAIVLPDMPKLGLQGFDRSSTLTVFLSQADEPEEFDQSLNQQLPLAAKIDSLADPSLGSTSIETGKDSIVSDAVQPSIAKSEKTQQTKNLSSGKNDGDRVASIRFDYATIKLFAKREAARFAELYPKKVERFARTFNRSRNYRRRSQTESYKDKLGDLYAQSNSSDGDICFKQKRDEAFYEYVTNTVYFFRCDSQPKGFELEIKDKDNTTG